MGNVQTYNAEKSIYHEGQPNAVLSVTRCEQYAVRFTDAAGKETMCLVLRFGKMKDGGDGIFMLASSNQMAEQLKRLNPNMLEQVRAAISNFEPASSAEGVKIDPSIADALDDIGLDNLIMAADPQEQEQEAPVIP